MLSGEMIKLPALPTSVNDSMYTSLRWASICVCVFTGGMEMELGRWDRGSCSWYVTRSGLCWGS